MSKEILQDLGVIAVLRGMTKESILPITRALKEGGVTAIEITMETPHALELIEMVSNECDSNLFVGAGTVLDSDTAQQAIQAGAKFIFSPTVDRETIEMTKRHNVISVPGAMTPTEILTAYECGADAVKVFPANTVGASYFKNIAGPLPHIPLIATGGVDLTNTRTFIEAGAIAVGAGSTLVNSKKELTTESLAEITMKANTFIEEVKSGREAKVNI